MLSDERRPVFRVKAKHVAVLSVPFLLQLFRVRLLVTVQNVHRHVVHYLGSRGTWEGGTHNGSLFLDLLGLEALFEFLEVVGELVGAWLRLGVGLVGGGQERRELFVHGLAVVLDYAPDILVFLVVVDVVILSWLLVDFYIGE